MFEVSESYSNGDVKLVVVCMHLNLSSCRRYQTEVISHEARGQKRSLRERVYSETKREKKTNVLMTLCELKSSFCTTPTFQLSGMTQNK